MKVATFVDAYLPGFKSGGPIISVSRIIEQDSKNTFHVITRDRDLGDSAAYQNVSQRKWDPVGRATVAYLRPGLKDAMWITRQLRRHPPDVYYLNSLQSPWFTLIPLLWIKLGLLPLKQVILAPRGEMSPGALALKRRKKAMWRPLIKRLIGSKITWHASSELERLEIISWWGPALPECHRIVVWADPAVAPSNESSVEIESDIPVIVFASRIDRMKGLLEAIEILSHIELPFRFHIHGQVTDPEYWHECQERARQLLPEDSWTYFGSYLPTQIETIFSNARVFIFPTHGENFGHVISEALSVGCPVILPATTQWTPIIEAGGGLVIRDQLQVNNYLDQLLGYSSKDLVASRKQAQLAYRDWYNSLEKVDFEDLQPKCGILES